MIHIPVLEKEILEYLEVAPNRNFVDCTVGGGGHASAILAKNEPRGKVLGIDRDPEVVEKLKNKGLSDRLKLTQGNFARLPRLVEKFGFTHVHGVLFDFGLCGYHLERSGRGFSFQRDEPLDMRFNPDQELKAEDLVNEKSESELEEILSRYGEEKYAERIARQIVESRERKTVETTSQLREIIEKAVPEKEQDRSLARTFQALRIAVNEELENIKRGLRKALRVVDPGGRIVAVSFHSLEDRIVKRFFKKQSEREKLEIITKKPVTPTAEEINNNPRSRSAKLRAAQAL